LIFSPHSSNIVCKSIVLGQLTTSCTLINNQLTLIFKFFCASILDASVI
jgi:hypothetical protein